MIQFFQCLKASPIHNDRLHRAFLAGFKRSAYSPSSRSTGCEAWNSEYYFSDHTYSYPWLVSKILKCVLRLYLLTHIALHKKISRSGKKISGTLDIGTDPGIFLDMGTKPPNHYFSISRETP